MSSPSESPSVGYEAKDASVRLIVITSASVFAGVLASLAVAALIYTGRYAGLPSTDARQTSFVNGPNARSSISKDVGALRSEVATHLNDYGWTDQRAGVVHIPLDRAMDLVSQEATAAQKAEAKP